MNKKYLYIAGGVVVGLLLLRACSTPDYQTVQVAPAPLAMPDPNNYPQDQPAPVIVQQQPAPVIVHDHDNGGGFFHGLLMGHLMSGGSSHHHTTVVNHHTNNYTRTYKTTRSYKTTRTYRAPKKYYGSRSRSFRSTSRRRR